MKIEMFLYKRVRAYVMLPLRQKCIKIVKYFGQLYEIYTLLETC